MHQLQHLSLSGVEICVETWGDIHASTPLMLVHGFTGSKLDWVDQIPPLAELGPLITIDQRGHGDSSNTGDEASYTLDTLVNDLTQVFDQLQLPKVHLLGHSMGGMVVMRFALNNPQLLASLILMDTSAEALPSFLDLNQLAPVIRAKGMALLIDNAENNAEQQSRRAPAMASCIKRLGTEEYFRRIKTKLEQMDPAAFIALAKALSDQTGVLADLKQLQMPTTIIVGEQDKGFIKPSQAMADSINTAQLCTIADAAHSPQMENPQAWFDCIKQHLLGTSAG